MRYFNWCRHYWWLALLVVALVLRVIFLGTSLTNDEASIVTATTRDGAWRQETQLYAPLTYLLTAVAVRLSESEWWLRLMVALLPALVTLVGVYALGVKLGGQKVGLLATVFLATNTFHAYYSGMVLPASLCAMWTVWSWFFLSERCSVGRDAYQVSRSKPRSVFRQMSPLTRDLGWFLVCSVAGIYTSYFYWLVLAGQWLYLLGRRQWRLLVWAMVVPVVSFLPWLGMLGRQLAWQQEMLTEFPAWREIVSFSLWRTPAVTLGKFLFGMVNLEANWLFGVLTIVWAVLLVVAVVTSNWRRGRWQVKAWLAWCALGWPVVLALLVCLWIPVVRPERLVFLLSWVYLILAWLVAAGRGRLRPAAWWLVVVMLAFNLGSVAVYVTTGYGREDWRGLLARLHETYDNREAVALFAYPTVPAAWEWYERQVRLGRRFASVNVNAYQMSESDNLAGQISVVRNYAQVITLDYLRLTDMEQMIPRLLGEWGFEEEVPFCYPHTLGCVRVYAQMEESDSLERPE